MSRLALASLVLALVVAVPVGLLHPLVVIGGLLGAIGVLVVVTRPAVGLVALLGLEPFYGAAYTYLHGHEHLHFGPLTLWKDALIIGLLVRGVAGRVFDPPGVRVPRSETDRLLIGYGLVYVALTAASPAIRPAVYALGRDVEGPMLMLAILYLRPSRRTLLVCAAALVGAAAIIGTAGLIERLGPQAHFQTWYGAPRPPLNSSFYGTQGKGYRAGSFLQSPLTLAFYLAAACPFAIGLTRALPARWRPLAVLAVAGCASGLVVTVTRSGYIGGFVGSVVAVALSVRNPRRRVALLGVILVTTGAVVGGYLAAGNETLLRTPESSSHTGALQRDVRLVVARPLGYGLGTTDFVAQRFLGAGHGSTESEFMAKALEGGVGGLLLYLSILFAVLMRLRAARLRSVRARDPASVALVAGAMGAVLGLVGASLFLGVEELAVEVVVWGAAGIALAHSRTAPALAAR